MKLGIPFNIIEKEIIPTLQFSNTEVLENKKDKSLRSFYLKRGAQLGNLLKNKVHIYFKDSNDKLLRVNTTIWAVTNNFVILKKGITIPKNSIIFID